MPVRYAFEPIVDAVNVSIYAYEALMRGDASPSSASFLTSLTAEERCRRDETGRPDLFARAVALGLHARLSVNVTPHGLLDARPVQRLIHQAFSYGLRRDQLIVEVTENETVAEVSRFKETIDHLRSAGVEIAIDDFGAGYAGLSLLAEFQPDYIKLDMHLIRSIDRHGPRQAIVRAILDVCFDLGIEVIAEGVETPREYDWFRARNVRLFQGYLFARPCLDQLPAVTEIYRSAD